MIFGYARVSTEEQNLNRQIDQLQAYGVEKIFEEKMTGTKKDRPQLNKMLEQLRKGDTIVIADLTRLSRSTKDLISLSEQLREMGVELISLKENIDTTTATGKMMFGMLAVLAQFERDLISERTKEGLKSARARGNKGGRPKKDKRAIENALMIYDDGKMPVSEICKLCGISKNTLYNYIRARNKAKEEKKS
ncbi:recombinase family protein [Clostridium perfringens]|uniref:recombinase family protein n=1 Tax=Clostridium perfringens TaxID=1502 RepID=UPI003219B9A3